MNLILPKVQHISSNAWCFCGNTKHYCAYNTEAFLRQHKAFPRYLPAFL